MAPAAPLFFSSPTAAPRKNHFSPPPSLAHVAKARDPLSFLFFLAARTRKRVGVFWPLTREAIIPFSSPFPPILKLKEIDELLSWLLFLIDYPQTGEDSEISFSPRNSERGAFVRSPPGRKSRRSSSFFSGPRSKNRGSDGPSFPSRAPVAAESLERDAPRSCGRPLSNIPRVRAPMAGEKPFSAFPSPSFPFHRPVGLFLPPCALSKDQEHGFSLV